MEKEKRKRKMAKVLEVLAESSDTVLRNLPDDLVGKIFQMLSLQEVFDSERVCKSWQRVVKEPYCWREIDICKWSQHQQCKPEKIDLMLQMLIARSCGLHTKLCVTGLPNDASFSIIANNAENLQTLHLPRGGMTNLISEQVGKFSKLVFLDVSYCTKMGAPALEAIGKQCKSLTGLKRSMHPVPLIDQPSQDDEAIAIANTMPKLKTLEIENLIVGTNSVMEIIAKCRELELLDVRGCWGVNLEMDFLEQFTKLQLVGPRDEDCNWDWNADSSSIAYLAWEFNNEDSDYDYDETTDGSLEDEDEDLFAGQREFFLET